MLGLLWGVVAVKGIIGLAVFAALNAGVLYLYFRYIFLALKVWKHCGFHISTVLKVHILLDRKAHLSLPPTANLAFRWPLT